MRQTDGFSVVVYYFSARQRNNAAFELVNLSVTDDNNKFCIVQEGGYVCVFVHYTL